MTTQNTTTFADLQAKFSKPTVQQKPGGLTFDTLKQKYQGNTVSSMISPDTTTIEKPPLTGASVASYLFGGPSVNKIPGLNPTDIVKNVVDAGTETVKNVTEDINQGAEDLSSKPGTMRQLLGPTKAVVRGVADIAGGILSPIGKTLDDLTGGKINETFSKIAASSPAKGSVIDKITNSPEVQKFVTEHPNLEKDFTRALNLFFLGEADVAEPDVSTIVDRTKTQMSQVIPPEGSKAPELKVSKQGQQTENLQKIQDTIMPKPTVKEAKIATTEGRLVKGDEPGIFKSGKPDKVLPSESQTRQVMTIDKTIPNAAKMDEPTLYKALDNKIMTTAKALEPEMVKTPLKIETVDKITNDWETLKKTQISEAKASDEGNVAKWQTQFEKFINKSGLDNMNDLWKTAKNYDASVKANVKNATDLSPEDLQVQKDLWLQNRAILRSAINDAKLGMGQTSIQAFSDMHDMYEAQNSILSKAKIDIKVTPSKFAQFTKDHPTMTKIAGGAAAAVGLGGLFKEGESLMP